MQFLVQIIIASQKVSSKIRSKRFGSKPEYLLFHINIIIRRAYIIYNISIVQFDTAHKFVSCRATEQTQLFIWKGELHAAMTSQKNKTEEMKKSAHE